MARVPTVQPSVKIIGNTSIGAGTIIKTSEFKTKCLELIGEVAESAEEIVITKNGRPFLRLAPCRERSRHPFGRNRYKIRIRGDIVSPMPAEWFEDDPTVDRQ